MENAELIQKAVSYAKGNFGDTAMSVRKVAAYAGFSMDYFNRIFLSHTGFTVMAYVNYIRIKKAMQLLRTTDKTVLEIALEVGYDSHEGFIKAFKKVYGLPPAEYRKQAAGKALYWGELADASAPFRFVRENPDFVPVDSGTVIDWLLEQDARRYGPLCTLIKYMDYLVAAPEGDYEKGILCVGDDGNGGLYLEILTHDFALLKQWLQRFPGAGFYWPEQVTDFENTHSVRPQSCYLGDPIPCKLPDGMEIRQLCPKDKDSILRWAGGKTDGFVRHLLNENHYLDPSVLDYGIFSAGELLAVAGCGIDEVHGFRMNNSCKLRFAPGREVQSLYKTVFAWVTNDILEKGIIPFDDVQHGEYAKTHGGFTAGELGYTTLCFQYAPK